MRFLYFINLTLLLFFNINSISYSCDFTKITMGTKISEIENKYEDLSITINDNYEDSTLLFTFDTSLFCKDDLLKNSFMNIYVKEKKLIGIQIEGLDVDQNNLAIYKFAQDNFGLENEKAKLANWVGAVDLSSNSNSVIYGKVMGFDGIFETLEISSVEYADYMIGGDIIEVFQ